MAEGSQPDRTHRPVFDVARVGAATLVLLAHARSLTLLDAAAQPALTGSGLVFYAVSGLGHEAVVVFFVLSGTLVTRSILALEQAGRWTLRGYATARLTRLWVVLIPCLLLGGVLDAIGLRAWGATPGGQPYGALSAAFAAIPRLDLTTLFGNVVFLQTIAVRPFGSNGALWSLAYEAWYYVLAGLAWSAWRVRGLPFRALGWLSALGAVATTVLTRDMLALASTWVLGASLAFLPARWWKRTRAERSIALVVLGGALVAARITAVEHRMLGDLCVALATAACLLAWGDWQPRTRAVAGRLRTLAGATYSLYLSHLPLLACLAAAVLRNRREPFGLGGMATLCCGMAIAVAYAALVWWCFERRTDGLRRLILHRRLRPMAVPPARLPAGAA